MKTPYRVDAKTRKHIDNLTEMCTAAPDEGAKAIAWLGLERGELREHLRVVTNIVDELLANSVGVPDDIVSYINNVLDSARELIGRP